MLRISKTTIRILHVVQDDVCLIPTLCVERRSGSMAGVVLFDLLLDRRLRTVVHLLDEFILEIVHALIKAHGVDPIEQHFPSALDIFPVNVVGVGMPVQPRKVNLLSGF